MADISIDWLHRRVPLQFWVQVNEHFQQMTKDSPDEMASMRTKWGVPNLTYRKLLSYHGAVKVPECCMQWFPRSQVSWNEDGVWYVDCTNCIYHKLLPHVATALHCSANAMGDLIEALLGWVYLRAKHRVREVFGHEVANIVEMIEQAAFASYLLD